MAEPHDIGLRAGAQMEDPYAQAHAAVPTTDMPGTFATPAPGAMPAPGAGATSASVNGHTAPTPSHHPSFPQPHTQSQPHMMAGSHGHTGAVAQQGYYHAAQGHTAAHQAHHVHRAPVPTQQPQHQSRQPNQLYDETAVKAQRILLEKAPEAKQIHSGEQIITILSKLIAHVVMSRTQRHQQFLGHCITFLKGDAFPSDLVQSFENSVSQSPLNVEKKTAVMAHLDEYRKERLVYVQNLQKIDQNRKIEQAQQQELLLRQQRERQMRAAQVAQQEHANASPFQQNVRHMPSARPTQQHPKKERKVTEKKKSAEFAATVYGGQLNPDESDTLAQCAVHEDEEEENLIAFLADTSEVYTAEDDRYILDEMALRQVLCCHVASEMGIDALIEENVVPIVALAVEDMLTSVVQHMVQTAQHADEDVVLRPGRVQLKPPSSLAVILQKARDLHAKAQQEADAEAQATAKPKTPSPVATRGRTRSTRRSSRTRASHDDAASEGGDGVKVETDDGNQNQNQNVGESESNPGPVPDEGGTAGAAAATTTNPDGQEVDGDKAMETTTETSGHDSASDSDSKRRRIGKEGHWLAVKHLNRKLPLADVRKVYRQRLAMVP
eukprot:m.125645 g.125645  ORF g.125645 m.125645 type:complete len:609 (-) comp11173_c0_seq2:1402-3228(-)